VKCKRVTVSLQLCRSVISVVNFRYHRSIDPSSILPSACVMICFSDRLTG